MIYYLATIQFIFTKNKGQAKERKNNVVNISGNNITFQRFGGNLMFLVVYWP
jgi:hypothetical protein